MSELLAKARALIEGPKRYPEVRALTIDLETDGCYIRHVSAMTGEKLHSKADIAEQFAYRDQIIAGLLAEQGRLEQALQRQARAVDSIHRSDRIFASEDRKAAELARAATSPEVLESLREANHVLTVENEALTARAEAAEAKVPVLTADLEAIAARLDKWGDDYFKTGVGSGYLHKTANDIREALASRAAQASAEPIAFTPFWPPALRMGERYRVLCDDKGRNGGTWLDVFLANDGDVHVSMQDWENVPEGAPDPFPSLRVRTHIGGGRNERTRQALLWLAEAIRLDTAPRGFNDEIR